jgi:hypothetical protein
MVVGDALMFLTNYRAWMKEAQVSHGMKIGVLTMEYSKWIENFFFLFCFLFFVFAFLVLFRGSLFFKVKN